MRVRPFARWSRQFTALLACLLVSVFVGIVVFSTSVSAADATWNDGNLTYEGNEYTRLTDQTIFNNLGLEQGSIAYIDNPDSDNPKVIYFPPGSDVVTVDEAKYVEYQKSGDSDYQQGESRDISAEPPSENRDVPESSCNITGGFGWAICPITENLAKAMDWAYEWISQFLYSEPIEINNTDSGLYMAWNIMRGFANVAFIIGFLVIIYSQITSMGISNYGIKKMLPRLIVAAVLMNLSYIICAIAVDLSNISGYAVQELFIQIRNSLYATSINDIEIASWESVTAVVLGGSAAVLGVGNFAFTVGSSATSAIVLLVPILLGLLVTLIVVLLVIAARQALIIILTIISPLAFVAYILPGTEKLFDKWRGLFVTMLVFFPAFSVVFGGSQLASAVIIQNSTTLIMLILGLGVQAAPLALAPLILKLSGGVLNRFAGIVNDPSKGLIDRSRNWAKEQSAYLANRRTYANDNLPYGLRRGTRWAERKLRRARQERIENYQNKATATYEASKEHAKQDEFRRQVELDKDIRDKDLDIAWNETLQDTGGEVYQKEIVSRLRSDQKSLGDARLDNRYAEVKTGHHPAGFIGPLEANDPTRVLINDTIHTSEQIAAEGLRKSAASGVLNENLAERMINDKSLQQTAAGAYGQQGIDAAAASAVSTMRSEFGKGVDNTNELMKHFNVSSAEMQNLIENSEDIIRTDSNGNEVYRFDHKDSYTIEAAITNQMKVGTVPNVAKIIEMTGPGGRLTEYRGTVMSGLAGSSAGAKAPFLGGKLNNQIVEAKISSREDLLDYVSEWVDEGKFSAKTLSGLDKAGAEMLQDSLSRNMSRINDQRLANLKKALQESITNENLTMNNVDAARPVVNDIISRL